MLTIYLRNTRETPEIARSIIGKALDTRAEEIRLERYEVRRAQEVSAHGRTDHPHGSRAAALAESDAEQDTALALAVQEPIEIEPAGVRIESPDLVFELGKRTVRVPVVDIAGLRVDGGPKRVFMLDGLVNGPLLPNPTR